MDVNIAAAKGERGLKLRELVDLLTMAQVRGELDVEITGISIHSQQVEPGELFVCIPGTPGLQKDRHLFINEAIAAGAAALIVERDVTANVPVIQVPSARYALAILAAHWYGYPSRELHLIGVTGTNGKTTTSHMIDKILAHAGYRTGLMGNIGTKIGSELLHTDINTQAPHRLQANLRKMKDLSTDYCVMEVTSQGLHMGRVLGCDYRIAVLTNVTQDHLDYHGTMENYMAAKGLLFSGLGNSFSPVRARRKFAILNADDDASAYFRDLTSAQVITYGIHKAADVRAAEIQLTSRGTTFMVHSFAGTMAMELRLVGMFNVYNALAAISTALAERIPLDVIRQGLADLTSVPGRMEVIDEGQEFLVLADYAHTPDGLDKALSAVREFAEGKIITVFGCGGDRDRTKRPLMGQLAAKYSDVVIITSDNPRSEDPVRILKDIERGLHEHGACEASYVLIEDRRQAIVRAIEMAGPGDIVLIAGKGHETYQLINDCTLHFDDREEAREAIRQKMMAGRQ